MGWETREVAGVSYGPYYVRYRRRRGDRVERSSFGSGHAAVLAARLDELERLERAEEALRWRAEQERLEQTAAFLRELDEAAEVLTRAELLASGCHEHKGQWRRRRRRGA